VGVPQGNLWVCRDPLVGPSWRTCVLPPRTGTTTIVRRAMRSRLRVLYAEKLLYRAEEAADCLGLSRKIYELIQSGILPAVKVDGCCRVRRDDLRAFVESLREIA